MLILTRKPLFRPATTATDRAVLLERNGHGIYIGPDIRVRVLEFVIGPQGFPSQVRLGIDAPREIGVWRDELERR